MKYLKIVPAGLRWENSIKAVFVLFCFYFGALGSSISVSGFSADSTIWDTDTVLVTGTVNVSSVYFKIMPGTTVLFLGPYGLRIDCSNKYPRGNSFFCAQGMPADSIRFTSPDTIKWKGIQYTSYNVMANPLLRDTFLMRYCKIEHCSTNTVNAWSGDTNSVLEVMNNLFIDNTASAFSFSGEALKIKIAENEFINNIDRSRGGAIRIEYFKTASRDAPFIDGNIFTGNRASEGGAIYIFGVNGCISNNLFQSNTGYLGAAIHENMAAVTIANNIIKNNTVPDSSDYGAHGGGGIYMNQSTGPISGNLIVDNIGSGIHVNAGYGTIANNTICNNRSSAGGGIYWESSRIDTGLCINNIIWGNHADSGMGKQIYLFRSYPVFSYCCIEASDRLCLDNVDSNYSLESTCFESNPEFSDTSIGYYSLQKSSPCINSGSHDTAALFLFPKDLNQNNRIIGGAIDIGCYEFTELSRVLNRNGLPKYGKNLPTHTLNCTLRRPVNNRAGVTLSGRKVYYNSRIHIMPSGIYVFPQER